jgi:hypothetical protein
MNQVILLQKNGNGSNSGSSLIVSLFGITSILSVAEENYSLLHTVNLQNLQVKIRSIYVNRQVNSTDVIIVVSNMIPLIITIYYNI